MTITTRASLFTAAVLLAPTLARAQAPAPEAEPRTDASPDGTAAPADVTEAAPPGATAAPPAAAPDRASAAAPTAAATPALATPATASVSPVPATDAPPPVTEPARPDALAVGKRGLFQPSLLLQFWGLVTSEGVPDGPDTTFGYRIRRAEIQVEGEIIPERIGYAVKIDPAKTLKFGEASVPVQNQSPPPAEGEEPEQVEVSTPPKDTTILQDVSIRFLSDWAELWLGQFRPPIGLESTSSSSKLPFPERALATRTFADRRDLGVKVEKQFERFGYSVGLFSGSGLNVPDANLQKDLVGRVAVYPIEGLGLGLAGYAGLGQRDDPGTKDIVEVDARLEVAGALVQGEYFSRWAGAAGDRTRSEGGYALVGYTFAERYQPVGRLGFVDLDADAPETITRVYELGFNYLLLAHEAKLQLAWAMFGTDEDPDVRRHEGILAAQVAF